MDGLIEAIILMIFAPVGSFFKFLVFRKKTLKKYIEDQSLVDGFLGLFIVLGIMWVIYRLFG
tara:strand:- start:2280 stop:2465 length:186 start_codon:yes stop_codon:yes gene_type:complete